MVEPLRHRQTKEAATDMFSLQPPRHISTLPDLSRCLLWCRYWRISGLHSDISKPTLLTQSGPAAKKDGAAQQRFVDSPNGTYGTSGWIAESVKLDIIAPNHRGPFVGFVGHEPAESGRRHRHRRAAQMVRSSFILVLHRALPDLQRMKLW